MKNLLICLIFFLPYGALSASSASPLRHIVSTFGSDYFFLMNESTNGKTATGYCFQIKGDKNIELCWKVERFYAWPGQLLLSNDGTILIRYIDIPHDQLNAFSVFMEVYRNGVIARSLAAGLFVEIAKVNASPFGDPTSLILDGPLEQSAKLIDGSDPKLLSKLRTLGVAPVDGLLLQFTTFDKFCYIVELKTGKVLTKQKLRYDKIAEAPAPWDK